MGKKKNKKGFNPRQVPSFLRPETTTGNKRPRTEGGDNNMPPGTPPKTGKKCQGQDMCKKYNDQRGCKSPCPDKKKHCCDVLMGNSTVCGKAHPRTQCPYNNASHQFRND